ncbi:hypothetical protein [Salibacterium sp. K-3]
MFSGSEGYTSNAEMYFMLSLLIAFLGTVIAYQAGRGQSRWRKIVSWGICLIFLIGPFLGWTISVIYALSAHNAFAAFTIFYFYPPFLITGIILLVAGARKYD